MGAMIPTDPPSSRRRPGPAGDLPVGLLVAMLATLLVAAPGGTAPTQDLARVYESGIDFQEFLAATERRRDQWHEHYEQGRIPEGLAVRAGEIEGRYRLLVVAEDWCGDSVNVVPYLARLAEAMSGLEMRIVDSEVGATVMEAHPTPDGRTATPTIVVLDEEAREVGSLVERPSELQRGWLANEDRMRRQELLSRKYAWYDWDRGEHAMAGTEGAEVIPELAPRDGDHEIPKRTYSAFHETGLDPLLRGLGVDTVVVTGLHTDICDRHTTADAFFRGYRVIVVTDGTEAFSEEEHEGGLAYLEKVYGAELRTTDELLEQWEESAGDGD